MSALIGKGTQLGVAIVVSAICVMVFALSAGVASAYAANLSASMVIGAARAEGAEVGAATSKPEGSKVTSMSVKSGKLTVKWKKVAGVDGYELKYSQDKRPGDGQITKKVAFTKKSKGDAFKKCRVTGRPVLNGDVVSASIRTFKIAGGKRVYSAWSGEKPCVMRTTWSKTFIAPNYSGDEAYADEYGAGEITAIKNKNPKVAKLLGCVLYVYKPGKATITFKYLGKRITLKANVIKWTKPFDSFKVGEKDITNYVNSDYAFVPNEPYDGFGEGVAISGKLNMKPARNWKIVSVQVSGANGTKKVAQTHKVTKRDNLVFVNLKNRATGVVAQVGVCNSNAD